MYEKVRRSKSKQIWFKEREILKSIIQTRKECFICHTTQNLHDHHIFMAANRKNSEKAGLKVWLCYTHHNGSNNSPHFNREVDLNLKQIAQRKYEETHTREDFIRLIGRNYLD